MTSPTASPPVRRALESLARGERPGERLTAEAFGQVMCGEAEPAEVAGLLMGLRILGEGADELTGAVRALREAMVRVEVPDRSRLVDTCGTGGGAVPTFNISTAAAIVAAAAGATVAKHGNRSYTSKCGSADVFEAMGVAITVDAARAARLLAGPRLVFLFAPAFHPAMRHVAPVRRALGVPTIMNVIGPLANPAGVSRQLLGVADPELAPAMAEVLVRLGAEHGLIVHGVAGLDEIAPAGPTRAWEVRHGTVRAFAIDPGSYSLAQGDLSALAGGSPAENGRRIERLLEAPARDPVGRAAVGLNAGAALYVAGVAGTIDEGVERAIATLEDGAAARVLAALREEAPVSTSE